MRGVPSQPSPAADLSKVSTEQLMRMRAGGDQFQDITSPTGTFGENVAAGAGKAITDMGRGAGQMARAVMPDRLADRIGLPTQAGIDEAAQRDEPLMKTGGGVTGDILGNVAAYYLGSRIPGGSTLGGQAVIGGMQGALRPVTSSEEEANNSHFSPRAKNTMLGAGTAAALKGASDVGSEALARRAAAKVTESAQFEAQNAVRDAALKAGREAGYVTPPSSVNPHFINQGIESVGGKYATQQTASVINQKVTDRLGREALGLSQTAPLTEKAIETVRSDAGKAYQAIKDISGVKFKPDAEFKSATSAIGSDFAQAAKEFPESTKNSAIEALNADLAGGAFTPRGIIEKVKQLRFEAGSNFKAFDDPSKLALARAQRQAADALDGLVERNLAAGGQQAMADAYKAARVTIAKAHDIEAALMPDGHINAQVLGKMEGLSGPLKTIGDFAGSFGKDVQPLTKIGSPGLTTARTAIGTTAGAIVGGPAGAAVGGALGFAGPWTVRQMMLSGAGQSMMATPKYGTAAGTRTLAEMLDSAALPAAGTSLMNSRRRE